jgi:membrane protein
LTKARRGILSFRPLRVPLSVAKECFLRWRRDNIPRMGAAIAYYAIFSLSPMLIVAVAVTALIFGEKAARAHAILEAKTLIGPKGVEAIQMLLDNATRPATGTLATILCVLVVVFGSSRVFAELRFALNHIWHVDRDGQHPIRMAIKDRFLAFCMVLGTGILLLGSLVATTALQAASRRFGDRIPYVSTLTKELYPILSFLVILLLFAAIFKLMPATRVTWRDVWIGAALTSLLFGAGRYLIGFYLSRTTALSVYGAAGSIVVLLWWIYYSVQILLIGGVFTYVFSRRFGSHRLATGRGTSGEKPHASKPAEAG